MTIFDFLKRLDEDPFDPELLALFMGRAEPKSNGLEAGRQAGGEEDKHLRDERRKRHENQLL